jgi:hypothetical protein
VHGQRPSCVCDCYLLLAHQRVEHQAGKLFAMLPRLPHLQVQQVFGGSLLGLEPADSGRLRGQGGGGRGSSTTGLQLDLPGWATDSGVFSSLANSIASSRDARESDVDSVAAAEVARHAQRLQAQRKQEQHRQQEAVPPDCGQLAVSPTADKENQGRKPRGGGQRKGQQPAGIDWQDFLSGKQII